MHARYTHKLPYNKFISLTFTKYSLDTLNKTVIRESFFLVGNMGEYGCSSNEIRLQWKIVNVSNGFRIIWKFCKLAFLFLLCIHEEELC